MSDVVDRLGQCLKLTRVLQDEFVRHAIEDALLALSGRPIQDVITGDRNKTINYAMRYVWLRLHPAFETEAFLSGLTPDEFDAAVDKAMSESSPRA